MKAKYTTENHKQLNYFSTTLLLPVICFSQHFRVLLDSQLLSVSSFVFCTLRAVVVFVVAVTISSFFFFCYYFCFVLESKKVFRIMCVCKAIQKKSQTKTQTNVNHIRTCTTRYRKWNILCVVILYIFCFFHFFFYMFRKIVVQARALFVRFCCC